MHDVEEKLKAVRDVYVNYPKQLELLREELSKYEQEKQDILHVIEFGTLDAVKASDMRKELKRVLDKRRKTKKDIELLEEVRKFTERKPNEHVINTTIGNIRRVITTQGRRSYRMRVRSDLQDLIK